jgi:hypothetical protein
MPGVIEVHNGIHDLVPRIGLIGASSNKGLRAQGWNVIDVNTGWIPIVNHSLSSYCGASLCGLGVIK